MAIDSDANRRPSDFEGLIAAFNLENVDYAIIGGYAVAHHGHVRNTQDLDIFVRSTPQNADRIVKALRDAGYDSSDINRESFTHDNGVRLGLAPSQIDVIAFLPGVDQDSVWSRRERGKFGRETAYFISRQDLIDNKRFVGRPQDIADTQQLEAASKKIIDSDS